MTCIAVVTEGVFRYRSTQGQALLAPGALLLGNRGACFECGHDHSRGDRSLAFHYDGAFFESVLSGVPGARRLDFAAPRLPPAPALAGLVAEAEALREEGGAVEAFGEVAIRLAGAAARLTSAEAAGRTAPSAGEERRVAAAMRRIEAAGDAAIGLDDLAEEARLSRYHFLRVFRAVAGMTPYQYVLRTRLHRAAVRLRTSDEPVSAIAFDTGFNDLSTFNRRFRRVMGSPPRAYREGPGGRQPAPLRRG